MYTAKEAREQVNVLTYDERKTVESKINQAVESCLYACHLDTTISEAMKALLTSQGFKVDTTLSGTNISW